MPKTQTLNDATPTRPLSFSAAIAAAIFHWFQRDSQGEVTNNSRILQIMILLMEEILHQIGKGCGLDKYSRQDNKGSSIPQNQSSFKCSLEIKIFGFTLNTKKQIFNTECNTGFAVWLFQVASTLVMLPWKTCSKLSVFIGRFRTPIELKLSFAAPVAWQNTASHMVRPLDNSE